MPRPAFEEIWRRRFTERGRVFDDDAGIAGWTESGLGARLRRFRQVWPGDQKGAYWLDAGCGAGSYTRYLASQGVLSFGLDYSLPSVQKARARSDSKVFWLVGDVTQLPLRANAMDGVMCFGVLQAVAGPERVVKSLVTVARPGGQIWIDALNGSCLPSLLKRTLARLRQRRPPLRYDDPARLTTLLKEYGAKDVQLYWVPILPAPIEGIQCWVERPTVQSLLRRVPFLGVIFSHAILIFARAP